MLSANIKQTYERPAEIFAASADHPPAGPLSLRTLKPVVHSDNTKHNRQVEYLHSISTPPRLVSELKAKSTMAPLLLYLITSIILVYGLHADSSLDLTPGPSKYLRSTSICYKIKLLDSTQDGMKAQPLILSSLNLQK